MLLIDANIILAYSNLDDVHHQRATKLWSEIETGKYGKYFTTEYIFNEVVGVTFRKFGKEKAIELGEELSKSVFLLNPDPTQRDQAWKLFKEQNNGLNFVDCTNLAAMYFVDSTEIATFDKEFQKIKGIIVVQ